MACTYVRASCIASTANFNEPFTMSYARWCDERRWCCESEVNISIMASRPPPSTPLFVAVFACQVHLPYPACLGTGHRRSV